MSTRATRSWGPDADEDCRVQAYPFDIPAVEKTRLGLGCRFAVKDRNQSSPHRDMRQLKDECAVRGNRVS